MPNKLLRAAGLRRNIEMTEHAIAKIGEFKEREFGASAVPPVVETFLPRFREVMDAKLGAYRRELETIEPR
jgi:hypothetical protein